MSPFVALTLIFFLRDFTTTPSMAPFRPDHLTFCPVVKDFAYVTIKKSGKPYDNDRFVFKTVMRWAMENSPMSPAVQKDLRKRFDL